MLLSSCAKQLMEKALSSKHGICLTLDSPYDARSVRQKLYAARRKLRNQGQKEYDDLSFLFRNNRELWIIPRSKLSAETIVEHRGCRHLAESDLPESLILREKRRV